MGDRLAESLGKLGKLAVLVLPGVIVILCMPIRALVHESHGLVGFFFGMLTLFSVWLMSKLIWIITGRDWLDDIL